MHTAILLSLLALGAPDPAAAIERADVRSLGKALTFHAPFDGKADAATALGDARVHTASSLARKDGKPGLHAGGVEIVKGAGKYGDAIRFTKKTKSVVYFPAAKNVDYRKESWSGTVSLWLSLDPAKDLEPGYVDPIQITDKKWNDASFFFDFTKDNPRDFRLGVFSDFKVWNPTNKKLDAIPDAERPLVKAKKPAFAGGKWTHIVFTFADFNVKSGKGRATFYLDGKKQGAIEGKPQRFTWDPSKAAIMIGLSYIGLIDDLAIFNRELSAKEVELLQALPKGVGAISAGLERL